MTGRLKGFHFRAPHEEALSNPDSEPGAATSIAGPAAVGTKPPAEDITAPLVLPSRPELSVPRVVQGTSDTATAAEDGPAVVVPVLTNDIGVVSVARINGVAVTPGSVITLASGARVIVNADGTVSYAVGGAFQTLGAGQTAQDRFTYVGSDGGGSALAPDGRFEASAINGTNGFVINGAAAGDRSGYSVTGIGDVNGDGIADLLIGALSADPNGETDAGTSYVVFGRRGGFGASFDLSTINGSNGFRITGGDPFDYSGASVSAAGDVNGDGVADFIIGAPWGESNRGANAGEAYVVFGRPGGFGASLDLTTLDGANGFVIRGGAAGDGLGFAVSAAGDVNGDGFADLIVGARGADGRGVDAGTSYVVFGRASGFGAGIDVGSLNGTNGFALTGGAAGDLSGFSVSSAGDVNGDGLADLIIGAPNADPGGRADAGQAYVVFGQRSGTPATLDLSTLNGTNGFTLSGARAGDAAGWSVTAIGDINGDGIGDLAIGAAYADPGNRENAGETYVVFGRRGGFGTNVDLSTLNGTTGFVIVGIAALNLTGHSVSRAGDINGDGLADLLVSSLYADGAGGTDTGETYVVFGRQGGFGGVLDLTSLNGVNGFAIGGRASGDLSGHRVSAAGDVNGDGIDDLIIGAPAADPGGRADAGASYVIYGSRNVERFTGETTVTVTVTGTNDAPVVTFAGGGTTASLSRVENTTTVATLTATDVDAGAVLTWSIVGGADAALFRINAQTGVLEFITPPDFEASTDQNRDNVYDVIVQVSDGTSTDTQTVSVTVTNANEAPVITALGGGATGGYTIAENTSGPQPITAADPDAGANLAWSIVGGADAALFRINPQTGVLEFITPPDFEAPGDADRNNVYDVVVQVSDGTLTDSQTVSVTVTNANEAPVITALGGGATGGYTIAENTSGPQPITAADPDAGANLAWSIVGGADAALFRINAQTGVLEFITAPDFEAPRDADRNNVYDVVVQVSDGTLVDTQTVNVTVVNVDEPPVITSNGGGATGAISVTENGSVVTMVAASAGQGGTVTYSIVGGADAALFRINAQTGLLEFIATPDFEAPADQGRDNVYDVIVQATEGNLTDTQTLTVTVTNVDEPPVITSNGGGTTGAISVAENGSVVTTVAASAGQGGTVTYSIVGGADAALFRINAQTGLLEFVSNPDFEAPADQGGDNVYDVIVQATEGNLTDTQTLTVRVTNANEAPVITSNGGGATATVSRVEGLIQVSPTQVSDPDAGTTLTYTIVGGADASLFTINPQTGDLQFVSARDFEAPTDVNGDNIYEVIIQVSDGTLTDTQTVNVTVTNANEAPVITSNGGGATADVTINENTFVVTTTTATDVDAGSNLTYSIGGGADAGLFRINAATGVLEFVNAPDFEAPADQNQDNIYEVVVQVSDGQLTDTQTVRVRVNDVADTLSLTAVVGSIAVNEGDESRIVDADVTVTGPATGYAGGTLRVAGLNGSDRVLVRITDPTVGFPTPTGFSASETEVAFDGIVFGTIAGGIGDDLLITFNTSATRAAIEALVENLTYRSDSEVEVATHNLTITLSDGSGVTAAPVTVEVVFTADVLVGTAGADFRFGGQGDDTISGFAGDDELNGGVGRDTIRGGLDDDRIDGGDDNDFLFGDEGDDFLVGGTGDNQIDGGSGIDTVRYEGDIQQYQIQAGNNGEFFVFRPDGGTDILFNVEFLQFDQQTLDLNTLRQSPAPSATDKHGGPVVCLSGDGPADEDAPIAVLTFPDRVWHAAPSPLPAENGLGLGFDPIETYRDWLF